MRNDELLPLIVDMKLKYERSFDQFFVLNTDLEGFFSEVLVFKFESEIKNNESIMFRQIVTRY